MEPTQRKIIYIIISIFCVFAVLAAVVDQISISSGSKNKISSENTVEEEKQAQIKQDFNSMFDNTVHYNNYDTSSIKKQVVGKDIVYSVYDIEETKADKYEVDIHLPLINIDNDVASSFNSTTQEVFANKATEVLNNTSDTAIIYSVNYTGFVSGDILSVILKSTLKEPENPQRVIVKTYNYNLKTNKEVSILDAIKQKGITQDVVKTK